MVTKAKAKVKDNVHRVIIKYVISTEKATMMIDDENKLQFIVDRNVNKEEIRREVESIFDTPVKDRGIKTMITFKGEKKAIVELEEVGKAREIASALKIL